MATGLRRESTMRRRLHAITTAGMTLLECILVAALIIVMAAIAVPVSLGSLDEARTHAAARHLAFRFHLARSQAVRRSAFVALRFEPRGSDFAYRTYVDGNRSGVKARDITAGIDRALDASEHLANQFPNVRFGIMAGLPPLDPGDPLVAGSDPVRIGSSAFMSFAPDGSGTSGTLFIRGRTQQAAVRVLGATGRIRVLKFDHARRQWITP